MITSQNATAPKRFWNLDRLHVFPLTEFCPFWDEREGTLRAGARFWRLDPSRPMQAVLYEEGGYTRFESRQDGDDGSTERLVMVEGQRPYKERVRWTEAGGEEVVAGENYSALPVVPMWGSRLHQSTLVGMRAAIDSYDLIRSGFANDLSDCAQIYWTISNAGGMTDADLRRFMDRLRLMHVAVVDADEGQAATPSVQEPPYAARKQYLDDIRAQIYEDFGALDVHTVAAGATNDHIDAAYQPMDEEASDFEQQVSEFVQQVFDYQSECHCSKTRFASISSSSMFDYQSECHCSKTDGALLGVAPRFDYQSECHCSKTVERVRGRRVRLITSQNATAPKPTPASDGATVV